MSETPGPIALQRQEAPSVLASERGSCHGSAAEGSPCACQLITAY